VAAVFPSKVPTWRDWFHLDRLHGSRLQESE